MVNKRTILQPLHLFLQVPGLVGLTMLAVTAGVAGNALYLQSGSHPAPLIKTRAPDPMRAVDAQTREIQPMLHPQPRPAAEGQRDLGDLIDGLASDPRIARVQRALSDAAYGPLEADGVLGQATKEAIMKFQLDQGLAVTGNVDQPVVDRLVAIGALVR